MFSFYSRAFPVHSTGSVIVTGASSTAGEGLCQLLYSKGYKVYAGVREPKQVPYETFLLDISWEPHHQEALKRLKNEKLIAIIHMEQLPFVSSIDNMTMAEWQTIFSMNVMGPMTFISLFLPLLHQYQGRVIVVSSLAAGPNHGPLSATQKALEAAVDSLRAENEMLSVSLVQKGSLTKPNDFYNNILDALDSPRPRTRYMLGLDVYLTKVLSLLPDRIVDSLNF